MYNRNRDMEENPRFLHWHVISFHPEKFTSFLQIFYGETLTSFFYSEVLETPHTIFSKLSYRYFHVVFNAEFLVEIFIFSHILQLDKLEGASWDFFIIERTTLFEHRRSIYRWYQIIKLTGYHKDTLGQSLALHWERFWLLACLTLVFFYFTKLYCNVSKFNSHIAEGDKKIISNIVVLLTSLAVLSDD